MQWTYKVITLDLSMSSESFEDQLNRLGAEGWELVGFDLEITMFFFKRLVPDEAAR